MENESPLIAIRHLKDKNALLSEGLDGGLVENQEAKAEQTAFKIIEIARGIEAEHIAIFASDQKRTDETANLIKENINANTLDLSSVITDPRLRGLNQGVLNLPAGYEDGEEFLALQYAWRPFWDHVENGDIFWRFGQADIKDNLTFKELKGKFVELGECYAEIMERHLDFILSFLSQNAVEQQKTLSVLVGHAINIRILKEIVTILKNHNSILNSLPIGTISETAEDYNDEKRFKFGESETLNLSEITSGLSLDQVEQELQILRAKMVQNGLNIKKSEINN